VANQLMNSLTALSLIGVVVSAVAMWTGRRTAGALGAPRALSRSGVTLFVLLPILGLGIVLPMLGLSILLVLLVEWAVLSRIPPVRSWLGLGSTA
jgi:uncharacterized iron-regulated membrane protein